ncbi:Alpha-mannosidase 2, partial [Coemansia aciculifera]
MFVLPRRYMRGSGLVLALAAVALVISGNRGAFPFGKSHWMTWFGEPGPATDRDYSLAPMSRNLTLHVVPHSHSDIGWNLSFQGYYSQSVHLVMRRVVTELWKDTRRRFTWGDLAFVDMWLSQEGSDLFRGNITWRDAVRTLVREGRWSVVGGTYV